MEKIFRSFFWRIIHPLSPVYRHSRYNGVLVRPAIKYCFLPFKPGSAYRPRQIRDIDDYEATLCHGLAQTVGAGDKVVIVGGGFGVTAIHAAQRVGPQGNVVVYEASDGRISDLTWAVEANNQQDRVSVKHALVGGGVKVYGEANGAEQVRPQGLPKCDVLELYCEGTEKEILSKMTIRPRNILVETHGFRGAPTYEVEGIMQDIGYEVENLGIAEPRISKACNERDIHVLIGTKKQKQ
jgi:hypothetical protein